MEEISQDYCVCAYNLSHTRTQQFARNALYTAVPLGEITYTFVNCNESVILCPAAFEEQHRAELTAYRTAAAYLKANNITSLSSPNKLEAEYCALASEKAQFYEQYKEAKIELLKLKDAKQNVALFFREDERTQHHER